MIVISEYGIRVQMLKTAQYLGTDLALNVESMKAKTCDPNTDKQQGYQSTDVTGTPRAVLNTAALY